MNGEGALTQATWRAKWLSPSPTRGRGEAEPRRAREGWEESFRAMAEAGDDRLLDEEVAQPSEWDEGVVGMSPAAQGCR